MKNIKTKSILLASIVLLVIGFASMANAASSSLYISPASITKTVGDTFNVSVGFNASGNKVCAVEGTLVFNNLSCQSITVAGDVMAQSSPTCSNPHFLIGIPNCTTIDKVLLTTSVKAVNAGVASVGSTGVDVIGEGASVGSASTTSNYTINALPIIVTPTPTPPIQQPKTIKTVDKTTPAKEPIKVAPKTTTPETINLQATPIEATGGNFTLNIIWSIVLIVGMSASFFVGKMSNKRSR